MLLSPAEAAFLKEQAVREGVSASDVVRNAIERLYRPNLTLTAIRALDQLEGDYLKPADMATKTGRGNES